MQNMISMVKKPFSYDKNMVFIIILGMLTIFVYGNSLGNGFVWDDIDIIKENPLLDGIGNLPGIFVTPDTLPGVPIAYYRPVTYLSFFIDRAIWGLNPAAFHTVNLFLHLAVTISLYVLIRLLFGSDVLAFLSALLFSIHPVNAETVNFLAGGRNTLLSALFLIIAFIMHIRNRRKLSLLFFALSLFSKEFGLMLPLLIVYHDRVLAPDSPSTANRGLRVYYPYGGVIIFYLVCRALVLGTGGIAPDSMHLWNRIMFVPELAIRYIKILVWPFGLRIPYYVTLPRSLDIGVIMYAFTLAVIILLIFLFRKRKAITFASLWFVFFFIPVSNIIPLGYIIMANRYMYLSSMGICLIAAYLISHLNRKIMIPVVMALCTVFAAATISGNNDWKDEHTFYSSMVSHSPDSSIGYLNLGMYLFRKGEVRKAAEVLEQGLTAHPPLRDLYSHLGEAYWELGYTEKAISAFEQAVKVEPRDVKNYLILSRIYEENGDKDKAELYIKKAKEVTPAALEGLRKRALLECEEAERLQAQNNLKGAERTFRRSLRFDPEMARALIGLGSVVAEQGRIDEAIEYFRKAAGIDPDNPIPHYNLSLAYRMKGLIREAEDEMALYRRLIRDSRREVTWPGQGP